MRFESMHKILKGICNSSNNKVNILKTIFIKYQIKLLDFLINYEDILKEKIKIGTLKTVHKSYLEKYSIYSDIPLEIASYIQYEHILYKTGMIVHIGEYEDEVPLFGIINYICVINNLYYLCLQRILNHGFDLHYQAFRVEYEEIYLSIKIESVKSDFVGYICSSKEGILFIN